MSNENIIEKLNNQIQIEKEILSVLPKNNKKNLQEYKDKAAQIKEEYVAYLNDIILEIKRRRIKIVSIVQNPKIEELAEEIKNMDKIELLNNKITSFEKMKLDEDLYVLRRFYKNNLELVNESILNCINKFKDVEINLSASDFNYSSFAKEYMEVFFKEMKKGDINSTALKDTFEKLYWKCSDIITHIELNFRSLYLKNEKAINKYFDEAKKQIMKDLNLNEQEAIDKYNLLKSQLIESKDKDTALIVKKFINNEETPKDFEKQNIQKLYKKLLDLNIDDLDKDQLEEFNKTIFRLKNSLYEYKGYTEYKFIFDEILKIYNDKQNYKSKYNESLKKVNKKEAELVKENKKIDKIKKHSDLILKIFNKLNKNANKLEKQNVDINAKINEIKKEYRELEENKVNILISTQLNESSTIYDALLLISPFYTFLVGLIKKLNEDITQEEIDKKIENFRTFIKYPKITIINNINMTEDKNIVVILKDKYNLCNINIAKEDLEPDNLLKLISIVNTIYTNYYIYNSKLDLEDIKFVLQANKILEETNN